jgi:hypothetical protein
MILFLLNIYKPLFCIEFLLYFEIQTIRKLAKLREPIENQFRIAKHVLCQKILVQGSAQELSKLWFWL